MAAPGFWDNQEKAQRTIGQLKSLNLVVTPHEEAHSSAEDLTALIEMAEDDDSLEAALRQEVERLERAVEQLELSALLSGPHDNCGAILSLNARDGGTDANDWADMLLRMYTQWAQKNEYGVGLLDRNDNDEAGINSATITIRGPTAYGYLKGETGLHRLVRISPFNADGKRQTSFAAVDVTPEVSDEIEIEINDADVREDKYLFTQIGVCVTEEHMFGVDENVVDNLAATSRNARRTANESAARGGRGNHDLGRSWRRLRRRWIAGLRRNERRRWRWWFRWCGHEDGQRCYVETGLAEVGYGYTQRVGAHD